MIHIEDISSNPNEISGREVPPAPVSQTTETIARYPHVIGHSGSYGDSYEINHPDETEPHNFETLTRRVLALGALGVIGLIGKATRALSRRP